jgi:MFS family permease
MSLLNACFMSTVFAFLLFGNILGASFATSNQVGTLPVSAYVLTSAICIIPASAIMRRFGRKAGFAVGALFGMLAGVLILIAAAFSDFYILVLAGACVGVLTAASVFLRFAAIEVSVEAHRGKAASLVLCGGILAALFASYLPSVTAEALKIQVPFAVGIVLLALNTLALGISLSTNFKGQTPQDSATVPALRLVSALPDLVRRASFLRAATISALGYSIMILIMNLTPTLLTTICRYPLSTVESVMTYHYLAMFLPFLFSGFLIDKLGESATLLLGIATYFLAIGVFVVSLDETNATLALILLGLGWNLVFIGATAALYRSVPAKCANASQTTSELVTGVLNFLAALAAGYFIKNFDFSVTLILATALTTLLLAVWLMPSRDPRTEGALP